MLQTALTEQTGLAGSTRVKMQLNIKVLKQGSRFKPPAFMTDCCKNSKKQVLPQVWIQVTSTSSVEHVCPCTPQGQTLR